MYKQCRIAFISSIVLLIILLSLYIMEPLAQMSVKRKMEKFHIETITIVPTIPYIRVTESTVEETEPEIEVEFDSTMPTVDYTKHHLTKSGGVFEGPSGRETYYNLNMEGVINYMRKIGYIEEEYPYWIRDDGCKMFGRYIMVAANLKTRPKGTILETSLGTAIVVDTGTFVKKYPNGIDIAVKWK